MERPQRWWVMQRKCKCNALKLEFRSLWLLLKALLFRQARRMCVRVKKIRKGKGKGGVSRHTGKHRQAQANTDKHRYRTDADTEEYVHTF